MIAPLNIDAVIFHQPVNDEMCPRSPVVNVAHHMQMINRQALDRLGNNGDKRLAMTRGDDTLDQSLVIFTFIGQFLVFVKQLFNQPLKTTGDQLLNLVTGILR